MVPEDDLILTASEFYLCPCCLTSLCLILQGRTEILCFGWYLCAEKCSSLLG